MCYLDILIAMFVHTLGTMSQTYYPMLHSAQQQLMHMHKLIYPIITTSQNTGVLEITYNCLCMHTTHLL